MNLVEEATWAVMSSAVLMVFWPWMLAYPMLVPSAGAGDAADDQELPRPADWR